MNKAVSAFVASSLLAVCGAASAQQTGNVRLAFDIQSKGLEAALTEFALATNLQVLFQSDIVPNQPAPRVSGSLTPEAALDQLLAGSGLRYQFVNHNTVTIRMADAAGTSEPIANRAPGVDIQAHAGGDSIRLAQAERSSSVPADAVPQRPGPTAVPEVLVRGSRSLNMDIERTRDDAQPYVVLDRTAIEESGATDIQSFLRDRLTMNSTSASGSQTPGSAAGSASSINLRSLGPNQTLILVDGHRTASYGVGGNPQQPDLNAIPLSAIERIEVLPATASGIYGGSATGGVINVVLRRDYTGVETELAYDNAFSGDAGSRRVNLSAGFSLESGRTNILISGSYSDTDPFLAHDRDFVERGREAVMRNNPATFLNSPSPPLGATTNIRSAVVVGTVTQNLVLDDGTPLNSPITYIPAGYQGRSSDNGMALLANAGQYNLALADSAQGSGGGRSSLLNHPTIKSGMLTVRREFAPWLTAFLQMNASENAGYAWSSQAASTFTIPGNAPNNPFLQNIRVTTPALGADGLVTSINRNTGAVGGVIVRLPADWRAEADYTWNRTRYSSSVPGTLNANAGTLVGTGALDVLRDTAAFPVDFSDFLTDPTITEPVRSTLRDTTLRVAGPILDLPAGPITLSTLLEHRIELIDEFATRSSTARTIFPERSQSVDSAYIEAKVPLVSASNRLPGVELLELQLAARWDDYSTRGVTNSVVEGSATTPVRTTNKFDSLDHTFGLLFKPLPDLTLRGSYGTGFLPPSVTQLVPNAARALAGTQLAGLTDPARGNEALTSLTFTNGGNPNLQPEESKSWSAGIMLTPRVLPGFRLSVDWTRIEKTDNISILTLTQDSLNTVVQFAPERVSRGPVPAGDPFGVGRINALDFTFLNIASAKVEAFDFALDYRFDASSWGEFELTALATRQVLFDTQTVPNAPVTDQSGVIGNLEWKGNASLTWSRAEWSAGWTARYYDSYFLNFAHALNVNQGAATVPSQTYHDVFVQWSAPRNIGFSLLEDTQVQLGVRNVFDKKPPVDVSNLSNNLYSTWGDPRLASYYVTLRKAF